MFFIQKGLSKISGFVLFPELFRLRERGLRLDQVIINYLCLRILLEIVGVFFIRDLLMLSNDKAFGVNIGHTNSGNVSDILLFTLPGGYLCSVGL